MAPRKKSTNGDDDRSHKAKGVRRRKVRDQDADDAYDAWQQKLRTIAYVILGAAIFSALRLMFAKDDEASAIEETVKVGTLMNKNTALFEKALKALAAEAGELETRVSAIERDVRKLKSPPDVGHAPAA